MTRTRNTTTTTNDDDDDDDDNNNSNSNDNNYGTEKRNKKISLCSPLDARVVEYCNYLSIFWQFRQLAAMIILIRYKMS